MRYKLQSYSDGAIYKLSDGSYEVETSQGRGAGRTVAEAIKELSSKQSIPKKKHREKPVIEDAIDSI